MISLATNVLERVVSRPLREALYPDLTRSLFEDSYVNQHRGCGVGVHSLSYTQLR